MTTTIGTDVAHAALLLKQGAVVAIPTETVYGLAADAFNEEAVLTIFSAKQRPAFDPLIVHVRDREQLDRVAEVPAEAEALITRFWPGPLTLVLHKRPAVPDLVTSGLDTVAVRMPAHAMTRALLNELDTPLAAPSANPFGYVSPTTAQHVMDQLGGRIPYILDGGACTVGVESTILGRDAQGRWVLFRPGGIALESIEAVVGEVHAPSPSAKLQAPGMLESHYAPRKPVHVGDVPALLRRFAGRAVGVISFRHEHHAHRCEVLSPEGDLSAAARHLFAVLRELDTSDCQVIVAERFPEEGLGRAINDRLRRAAAGR
ncbi:MAG: threonylcarbamoyl-AMP synthase [Flavobacteriales bacterium]|jgi:L-threonylcarbamoyladenylate synthase|nr:threonylcarbamoyl-AMP synthase [Flavobacteriales bacterium]MBK7942951.1 threonylcarbamoyl-AMP synthase [Flavobacteriales bacterium]MBK8947549.1 threonylcarbamoyl-AMP synthase [Flavobacteriales bacterium]